MGRNDWDEALEINDFSKKNDKGSKRRAKEDKHWDKPMKVGDTVKSVSTNRILIRSMIQSRSNGLF